MACRFNAAPVLWCALALLAPVGGAVAKDAPDPAFLYASTWNLASDDRVTEGALAFYCDPEFNRIAGTDPPASTLPAPRIAACKSDRLIARKGETITVVYVFKPSPEGCPPADAKDPDVGLDIRETARKSAASAGLSAIVKYVAKAAGAKAPDAIKPAAKSPPDLSCYRPRTHVLVRDRATVDLTLSITALAPPANETAQSATASYELLTGSAEHVFFSGDAIVRGAKELKYDPDKKALFERDKPDQLYLGINYMWGDVYQKYPRAALERVALKALITPTRHPFDSVGLAVGYRFADLSSDNDGPQATGGFMLFAGHFWTRNETAANDGAGSKRGRSGSWRVGVSYSLDTLLGWLP